MISPYYLSPQGQRVVKARAEQLRIYLQSKRVRRVWSDLQRVRETNYKEQA